MTMRRYLPHVLVLTALGTLASACQVPSSAKAVRSAGSLAFSSDGQRLLIVDGDNNELLAFDPGKSEVTARVKLGQGASRIVVAQSGRAYVSNRFDRSVSVVDVAEMKELSRIPVGAEPDALALTDDGKQLVVGNRTSRSLSIVDTASSVELSRVQLPGDPSGLRVIERKAFVAYGRQGELSAVDLDSSSANAPASMPLSLTIAQAGGDERVAAQAVDPVYEPSSGRLFAPHVQSRKTPLVTSGGADPAMNGASLSERPISGSASYASGFIPVVANAIVTVDAQAMAVIPAPEFTLSANAPKDCLDCAVSPAIATVNGGIDGALPTSSFTVSAAGAPSAVMPATGPMSGPQAAVLDPSGRWLYVVNLHSNNVQIVPVDHGASEMPAVRVGRGPTGIAIDADGKRAYVYNSFDHTVSVIEAVGGALTATREYVVGASPLTPEQELGRKLFFAADDARMTNSAAGGIACASCHPGGRDDGRTWQFSEGLRNTPALAGRHLAATAPYHWDGELADMHAFRAVVESRMGGSGTMSNGVDAALEASDFNAMLAYLESLPSPDNPRKGSSDEAAVARGEALFTGKAACASCHGGADYTDNGFHDVQTIGRSGVAETFRRGVNTPPLHNLFDSAPYLHDGSIATLRERLTNNPGDAHGVTSGLSAQEVDDLVAYLEQL